MIGRGLLALALCWLLSVPAKASERHPGTCAHSMADALASDPPAVVIIIDDLGYQRHNSLAATRLPGRINLAILPFTPHGRTVAAAALTQPDKELLLHAPMSSLGGEAPGPGALTATLEREAFQRRLIAALEDVPQVRGLNNHMGSDLTTRRPQMQWLMEVLRARQLYFVDSRTHAATVAATLAAEYGLPHLSRHVFLDNLRTPESINERFEELLALARVQGFAVGIGHPYPETLEFLEQALPELEARGLRLALISELLETLPAANLVHR